MDDTRFRKRADRILSKFMRKASVVRSKRATFGTMNLTGGDAHGIVNDAVNLVAANKRAQAFKGSGHRGFAQGYDKGPQEWTILRMPYALPKWLRGPFPVSPMDLKKVAQFETVQFQSPPLDITVKNNADLGRFGTIARR